MYTLGTKIIFGKDGTSDKFLMTGWSYPEDGSTWTEGYKSVLGIPTTKTDSDLNLTITQSIYNNNGCMLRSTIIKLENGVLMDLMFRKKHHYSA